MKQTVEEAAMNFANYESNNLDKLPFKVKNVVDYDNGLTRGLKAGADWQAKQSPWISVEDAIPNEQASANGQKKYQQGMDFMKSKAITAFKENCPCWSRFQQDRKCDKCTWLKEFCNKLDE